MQRTTGVSQPPQPTGAGWAAQLRAEQIAALYRRLPRSLAGSTAVAVLAVALSYGSVSPRILGCWLVAMLAWSSLRLLLWRRFVAARPDAQHIGRWGSRIVLTTTAAGILWGVGGVVLHTSGNLANELMVLLVAILVGLASTFTTAPLMPAFLGFVYPIFLLSAAPWLLAGDPLRLGIGIAALLLLPLLTQMAARDGRAFAHAVRMRMQNDWLLDELRRQKQAAETANEAKSRFLAVASHDLRQPLHALGLFVEALQVCPLAARERQIVDNIHRSVDALEGLFDALMDISRLEAGAVKPRVETFGLGALLERLRIEFEPIVRQKGLALRVMPTTCVTRSDPALLERILRNFVSNAVRYTSRGGVLLGCRRSGDRLRIEVWDTGHGIPADKQREVFREFAQLEAATQIQQAGNGNATAAGRRQADGTGLGLAIVERLAGLLDHPVRLRSTHGRGSVFAITVPRAEFDAHEHGAPAAPSASELAGLPVLLIDPDPAARAILRSWLLRWNCEVTTAQSPAEVRALLTASQRVPCLIITRCSPWPAARGASDGDVGAAAGDAAPGGSRSAEASAAMAHSVELVDLLRAEYNEPIPAVLLADEPGTDRTLRRESGKLAVLHEPLRRPEDPARLRALVLDLLRADGSTEHSPRALMRPPPQA